MPTRIKNWAKYQHFKDRRPPWVKLYRDILDDLEWHQLEPRAAKVLVMLWLIASENDGNLPEAKELAFRLRTTERDVLDQISKLSHWLIQDDITPISIGNQPDPLETEERQRRDRDRIARDFAAFYAAYPKKKAPADAEKAFAKVKAPIEVLLAAIREQCETEDWQKEKGRYIPYPATWLNQRQWENATQVGPKAEWHETKAGVQARAAELGLPPYNELEQFPVYRARVMAAHAKGTH
jgi:hypothetical protein